MCSTDLYEKLVLEFPATWPTSPEWDWMNVHDGTAPNLKELRTVLDHHIQSTEVAVLVHSNPGVGAILGKEQAIRFMAKHILRYEIQAADPLFESFILIAESGAATGWSSSTPGSSRWHSAYDA